jgi:quinol monooxygenase YgiN
MPITFISHFRVKPGRTADVRAMTASVSGQLEAAKPGTMGFLPYLGEEGTTFTIVHLFADADAMAEHFAGADQRSAAAYELIEPAGWEIYGKPHAAQVDGLRAEAEAAGVELQVHPEELAGFLRPSRT